MAVVQIMQRPTRWIMLVIGLMRQEKTEAALIHSVEALVVALEVAAAETTIDMAMQRQGWRDSREGKTEKHRGVKEDESE